MLEAERLVKAGVKELLVISQDTSAYGVDLKYATGFWGGKPVKAQFADLARALGSLGAWVRMHYVYPYPHVDDVIPLMAEGKVLPYLDIPFQHGSPRVLKLHEAPGARREHARPHRALARGVPGHHAAQHVHRRLSRAKPRPISSMLLDWLREARLDRVGCFKYSPVDGAAANALPDPVPEAVKEERLGRFMEVAAAISAEKLAAKVGQRMRVLVDSVDTEEGAVARSCRGRAGDRRRRAHRQARQEAAGRRLGGRADHRRGRVRPVGEDRTRLVQGEVSVVRTPFDQSRAGHGTGSGPRLVFLTHVCQVPSALRAQMRCDVRRPR